VKHREEPPERERGGAPGQKSANTQLHQTTRHHPGDDVILSPHRARSRSWPTIACIDGLCVYCRCGRSLVELLQAS
jgi:hypothetical protein